MQAERFIEYVIRKGSVSYEEAYRMIHLYFPDHRDFEGILSGAIRSGQIELVSTSQGMRLQPVRARITPDSVIV